VTSGWRTQKRVTANKMPAAADKKFSMLLVDDSTEDRRLFKSSLSQATRLRLVAEAGDGQEALNYFEGLGQFADRDKYPLPDLLLLDLNMPRVDGFEVLTWLQTQAFNHFTVVLTDSKRSEDIKRALDLGADLYQIKPRRERDRQAMALALEELLVRSHVETPVIV
jgi:CheY-like chemotaxis protein